MSNLSNILIEITSEIKDVKEAKTKSRNITDKIYTFFYAESLLTGESSLEIEIIVKNLDEEEKLQFSNGIHAFRISVQKNDIEQTTGWKMFICSSSSLYYHGSFSVVRIIGKSLLSLLKEKVHWKAYSQASIKNIISIIASNYNMQTQVIETSPSLEKIYQCGETDFDFLCRMKNEVISTSGQKQIYLFSRNKTLYFSSIDYSKPIVRKYNMGAGDDRVDEINFCYNGREITQNNGSEFIMGYFNILKKKFDIFIPNPASCTVLAPKLGTKYESGISYNTTLSQDFSLIQGESFAKWNNATKKYFSAQITSIEEVGLNLGDIIEIHGIDADNKTSSMNGKYPIFELAYSFSSKKKENKNLFTHIGCFRRSFHYGDIPAEGIDLSKIIGKDQYLDSLSRDAQSMTTLVAQQL